MSEEGRGGADDKDDKCIDFKAGFDRIEVRVVQGEVSKTRPEDGDNNKKESDGHKEGVKEGEKNKDNEDKFEQGVRMGTSTGVGLYGAITGVMPGRVYGDDICFML